VRSLSGQPDITPVTAADYVRRNVSRFFASGRFTPQEAAGHLVLEALLCGARRVEAQRAGPWWVVRGDVDWLTPPLDEEAFGALVPFLEGGPNASRSEILVAVFATDVVVDGHGGKRVIKGEADSELEAVLSDGSWARSVAFRE
jgi:hypothetical protein